MTTLFVLRDQSGITTDRAIVFAAADTPDTRRAAEIAAENAGLPSPVIDSASTCSIDVRQAGLQFGYAYIG